MSVKMLMRRAAQLRPSVKRGLKHALYINKADVKALKKQLRATRDFQIHAMREVIKQVAVLIRRDATIKAPVDTGYLKKSSFVIVAGGATKAKSLGLDAGTIEVGTASRVGSQNVNTKAARGETTRGLSPKHYIPHPDTLQDAKAFIAKVRAKKQIGAAIGFWAEYALPVHEVHPEKSNFLRNAVNEWRGTLAAYMSKAQMKAIKKSIGKKQRRLTLLATDTGLADNALEGGTIGVF